MRTSTRLAVGLSVTSVVVLGAYGTLDLNTEQEELTRSAQSNARLLATAIATGVEHALRDEQHADIREILDDLELKDSAIDVFVFDRTSEHLSSSWGSSSTMPLARAAVAGLGQQAISSHFEPGLEHLVVAVPLLGADGTRVGSLAVVKPLDALRRDLVSTRNAIVASTLTLIAGLSLVGWLLVIWSVGRPLARLTQAMTRVRSGDLTTHVPESRDDVGEVAREFNVMVRRLADARAKLLEEADARRVLEEGLQRVNKLATVGQLAASLAHEIGSPLQVLNGRARALVSRGDASAEVKRNAQIMVEQSDRITGIVQRLLDLARRSPHQLASTDVTVPVRAVVDLVELEARRRQVTLELYCAEGLPKVLADAAALQQIVLNLLDNALRASKPKGSVTVAVKTDAFRAPGDEGLKPSVVLEVTDRGTGIAPQVMEKIFEPFFTTWPEGVGTGLGLAVVKAIATAHSGVVMVSSKLGEGTRITVHIPQAEAKVAVA